MSEDQIPFHSFYVTADAPGDFHVGRIVSNFEMCGLFLCCQGSVQISLDNQVHTLRRGDLYIYMPSTVVRLLDMSLDAEGIIMDASVDFALPISNKVMNTENLMTLRQYPCLHLSEEVFDYLWRLMVRIGNRIRSEEIKTLSPARRHLLLELIKSMGHVVFYEVLNIYFANRPQQPIPNDRKDLIFQNFMLSLYQYYQKERDVAFYARLQHITPRYFSTIIKEKSGLSASRWIVQMVVAEAKRYLEVTDLSIKEVSVALNFPNQSFFGKYFKQHVGMSPYDYRRSCRYMDKNIK
ncbi:MAG: AraC family transcriptional regulator [Parabacteroides sp.]